ncbi:uncharacterized protein BCR38DRAFT_490715 [Pseudomassariella vexata]|uniref:Amidohydrolase-related domain-containing protein n=1 Tax=Pseudomassariella vexata TaxID=1141098 RepID=A0A1Y2DAX8_9PEZI|nr:uncharacterized protein BCR38DRAFT_490715 [Pseudomassariella vexata]ORY56420.1 hypothetical protein BCR38DRAFT_490715 [Pseudomassariella vexata]
MPDIAFRNELIFDGTLIKDPESAVIDGTGCTLLPSLIDCHVHRSQSEELDLYGSHSIAAVLASPCVRGSRHDNMFNSTELPTPPVEDKDDAAEFVQVLIAEGAGGRGDNIEISADEAGFSQIMLNKFAAS